MAASPQLKIFDNKGTYQASCKEYEAAAALMAFYGEGARVNGVGRLSAKDALWVEGKDGQAAESYDTAADLMQARERELENLWIMGQRGPVALVSRDRGIEPTYCEDIPAEHVLEFIVGRRDRLTGRPVTVTQAQIADPLNPELVDAYSYGNDTHCESIPLATGPRAITRNDVALIVAAYERRADVPPLPVDAPISPCERKL